MKQPVKVGVVNYLNAKPLIAGLQQHPICQEIELTESYPAAVANALIAQEIDLGLVPVATLPRIPNGHIIGNYGIAASGKVASVCIFSKVPITEVSTIYLDYQSRTSVRLAQILLKKHFRHEVKYLNAPDNFIDLIEGTTAAVIIGDRALEQLHNFEYVYDLADEWQRFTGLPFVFAAWIANKPLDTAFIEAFDAANAFGLTMIPDIAKDLNYSIYDLNTYYTQNIHYILDEDKKAGLQLYLQYLDEMKNELL